MSFRIWQLEGYKNLILWNFLGPHSLGAQYDLLAAQVTRAPWVVAPMLVALKRIFT